jgi:hypothetical protein
MNEPLFGSVPSTLPTTFPFAGWPGSPMSVGGRPFAGGASPVSGSLLGTVGLPTLLAPAAGITAGTVTSALGTTPVGAATPSFAGSEVALGVPVSALLATIAVRRGQPLGPSNDQEIEDFIYDALEALPGSSEIDVRCEGGRVTFTGTVHYKRLKRDVGEIAWAIPGVNDVHNTVAIAARRRRGAAQGEPQAAAGRKSA